MKGLCFITRDEARMVYHDAGWDDAYINGLFVDPPSAVVNFNACIPLKLWLGFAEDYERIIGGVRQDLILTRAHSDRNALVNTAAGVNENTKVELKKITLMMPVIRVSDNERITLLRIHESKEIIEMTYRSWDIYENPALMHGGYSVNWSIATSAQLEKPRFIIIAFQTLKKDVYAAEIDRFDHIDVRDIKLCLNSEFYPYYNPNVNFKQKQASFLYQLYAAFQKSYHG